MMLKKTLELFEKDDRTNQTDYIWKKRKKDTTPEALISAKVKHVKKDKPKENGNICIGIGKCKFLKTHHIDSATSQTGLP